MVVSQTMMAAVQAFTKEPLQLAVSDFTCTVSLGSRSSPPAGCASSRSKGTVAAEVFGLF
jgi:hypothetical protein